MGLKSEPLPFGVQDISVFDDAVITHAFISPKSGGKQQITIFGNGEVALHVSVSADDPAPKILKGMIDPVIVVRLLDIIDGIGFMELDENYYAEEGNGPFVRRLVRVSFGSTHKEVNLYGRMMIPIEKVIQAIQFAASLALPEAINHRFFNNL